VAGAKPHPEASSDPAAPNRCDRLEPQDVPGVQRAAAGSLRGLGGQGRQPAAPPMRHRAPPSARRWT